MCTVQGQLMCAKWQSECAIWVKSVPLAQWHAKITGLPSHLCKIIAFNPPVVSPSKIYSRLLKLLILGLRFTPQHWASNLQESRWKPAMLTLCSESRPVAPSANASPGVRTTHVLFRITPSSFIAPCAKVTLCSVEMTSSPPNEVS
jgi:hypothetical protein